MTGVKFLLRVTMRRHDLARDLSPQGAAEGDGGTEPRRGKANSIDGAADRRRHRARPRPANAGYGRARNHRAAKGCPQEAAKHSRRVKGWASYPSSPWVVGRLG